MDIILYDSVTDFLDSTESFRSAYPFETNIVSSVAQSVQNRTRTYDAYFWWAITDETGQVQGVAMRTAPHGMLISPMSDAAISSLALKVAKFDDQLPGVGGPKILVDKFLSAYKETRSTGSQREVEIVGRELPYVLGDLVVPEVQGEIRIASDVESELIYEWMLNFAEEAGIYMHDAREGVEDSLRRRSLRLWIVNEEIVSMAGHAPIVNVPGGSVARIGPVYTPPLHRRRGYAGAVTAALSQELRNAGAKVMLYTDATNPTSNSVYQKIGYVQIGEHRRVNFVTPS